MHGKSFDLQQPKSIQWCSSNCLMFQTLLAWPGMFLPIPRIPSDKNMKSTTKPSIPMSRPVSAAGRTSSSPATWTSGVWRRYEKPTAPWNPGMCWWPSMVDLQRTPKPGCKFPGGPIGPWEKNMKKWNKLDFMTWEKCDLFGQFGLSRGKWKFVLYIVLLIRSCFM